MIMGQRVAKGGPHRRRPFGNKTPLIGNLILALGIAAAGIAIGCSLQRFRNRDLTVTVKGLSEKVVKSDLAIWTLIFKNSGADLGRLEQKTLDDKKAVLAFLKKLEFTDEEVEEGSLSVLDKNAREWVDNKEERDRFIFSGVVTVRSKRVDAIRMAAAKMGELIKSAVILSGDPAYYYTQFLDLKQSMLAEATHNAIHAANKLVEPTHAKLNGIRQASQGTFTIRAKDAYSDDMSMNEQASIEKRIRVVTTITFNLEH